MTRRTLATTVVVVLLVASGCVGFGSGTDSTPNGQVETATGTPTPTATPAGLEANVSTSDQYPDGWSETGVEEPRSALNAHYRAVLTGGSTTVTYRNRVIDTDANRSRNTTLDLQIDPESQRLYAGINGTAERRELFFANGTLSRWSVKNQTVLGTRSIEFLRVAQSIDRGVLESQLVLYTLESEDTIERNGRKATVYNVTGVRNNTVSRSFGAPTAVSGQIIVSTDGRILDIDTRVVFTGGTVSYRYTQTNIGETVVNTPDWAQR